jgi:alpha-1,3-rhamnosyltransferase
MENENNPLVSIIVITYNSSKYVLETLESAKVQTYQNIELIVSDDCSSDDTLEICRSWLNENQQRFKRVELVTSEKNTGIAPNCNRGLKAAKGEWVKLIAGDDILLGNCINEFIDYIQSNNEAKFIFSNILINGKQLNNIENNTDFFCLTADRQYNELLKGNILNAPASFMNREATIKSGCFNEKYPLFEDYPFFLKILRNNYKLYKIYMPLVSYRKDNTGISSINKMNIKYHRDVLGFFKEEYLKELFNNRLYIYLMHYLVETILLYFVKMKIIRYQNNYKIILSWFSPLHWCKRFKNLFMHKYAR